MLSVVFFGSFQDYSVRVLETLVQHFSVIGVVTTPPAPSGRHLQLSPTEVSIYSKRNNLNLFELSELTDIPFTSVPDFFVVAGYGKLIPSVWLKFPKIMCVNLHPSLLPKYRGRFPAEWAILRGETETGITLLHMSPEWDRGEILAQKSLVISPTDTKHTLYPKLFNDGSELLVDSLPQIANGNLQPHPQAEGKYFYARQLTREDGFVPWDLFTPKNPQLDRLWRALHPWPGVWSTNPEGKRIKLISLNPLTIQLESRSPQPWKL